MSGFSDSAFSAAPMSTPVQVNASADLIGVFAGSGIGSIELSGEANVVATGVGGDARIGKLFLWFPIDPNQNPNWTDTINSP